MLIAQRVSRRVSPEVCFLEVPNGLAHPHGNKANLLTWEKALESPESLVAGSEEVSSVKMGLRGVPPDFPFLLF